jgi:hypothetical protein
MSGCTFGAKVVKEMRQPSPNKAGAGNGAGALRFHIRHFRGAVPDLGRCPDMKSPPAIVRMRNSIRKFRGWAASVQLVLVLMLLTSCSHGRGTGGLATGTAAMSQALSESDAAQLAAKLANEECEHRFKRRPFRADQYVAVLKDGEYRWGRLDVGAPAGYSAVVTFKADGSKPSVEVYLSAGFL